ncbi:hypothetical protein CJF30_00002834 [Rutstroemia sp. NJR-2017a BBW]|nr:hypothetical protein CJF30_00002834 [Rutstroemia sp. NJR-2017a BBW]
MSTLGWIASFASSVFVLTTLVEAIAQITDPDFAFSTWQYTLLMIGYLLITIVFNTWLAKTLPMIETFSLFGHLLGFIVVLVPLWVMAPKNSASDVFLKVVNNAGWTEEVEDASINVPRAMWWSYLMNVFLGIIMLATMLFCIGDLNDAIDSTAPYLNLFLNTGSTAMATVLMIILLLLIFSGNVTALASTSREMWAFSRDKGFPYSKWISRMNHALNIPPNSIYLTSFLTTLLCLINFGSSFAFNIIVSLSLLALLSTYMISIGCVLLKRIRGEPLPHARWSLGRWGLPINAFAFAYSGFIMCGAGYDGECKCEFILLFAFIGRGVKAGVVFSMQGRNSRWNCANMDSVGSCGLGGRYFSVGCYICCSWKEALYPTSIVCGGKEGE